MNTLIAFACSLLFSAIVVALTCTAGVIVEFLATKINWSLVAVLFFSALIIYTFARKEAKL